MAATRIYLPSSGAAPVTPSTWNHANQAASTYTCAGVLTKGSTAMTSRTTASGTTNPYTRAVMRYVIGPLADVEISGTVNAVMRASEANGDANATMSIAVKIIQPGGTDRSVLLAAIASDLGGGVQEFTTTLSSRRAYNVTETRPIPLTAQTPTRGDYLVIEIGFRSAGTTTRNVLLRHGDDSGSDLVDGEGATDDYAPWAEFSNGVTWFAAKSVTDSGTGTDAVGVKAKASVTDTGTGADAVSSVLRRAIITDAGVGVDSLSVKALLGITDTGTGVDTAGIRARIGGLPLSPWSRCKRIALPIPTANLVDFPEKVPIIADADIGRACRADGFDIRFTADDGGTLLPYERESWTGGGGAPVTAIFWVKTSVATAGTHIWLYYGNAAAADGADPEAVWDTNFKAVYHLKDATTSTILDSTANDNDGAKLSANHPAEVAGKIGKGQDFGGTANPGNINCGAKANLSGAAEFTIEAWLNFAALQETYPGVLRRCDVDASGYVILASKTYKILIMLMMSAGAHQQFNTAGQVVPGAWTHFAYTYKASTLKVNTFLGGAPDSEQNVTTAMVNANNTLYLGSYGPYIDGLMDEVRISSVARSADWIAYEYANMNPADGGLTWGAEESGPLADSGIGTDAVALVTAKIGIADAGSGADIVSKLDARLTVSDVGSGADAIGMLFRVALQELAQGDDSISVITLKLIQDAGLGTEYVFIDPIGAVICVAADVVPRERSVSVQPRKRTIDVVPRDRTADQTRRP